MNAILIIVDSNLKPIASSIALRKRAISSFLSLFLSKRRKKKRLNVCQLKFGSIECVERMQNAKKARRGGLCFATRDFCLIQFCSRHITHRHLAANVRIWSSTRLVFFYPPFKRYNAERKTRIAHSTKRIALIAQNSKFKSCLILALLCFAWIACCSLVHVQVPLVQSLSAPNMWRRKQKYNCFKDERRRWVWE